MSSARIRISSVLFRRGAATVDEAIERGAFFQGLHANGARIAANRDMTEWRVFWPETAEGNQVPNAEFAEGTGYLILEPGDQIELYQDVNGKLGVTHLTVTRRIENLGTQAEPLDLRSCVKPIPHLTQRDILGAVRNGMINRRVLRDA